MWVVSNTHTTKSACYFRILRIIIIPISVVMGRIICKDYITRRKLFEKFTQHYEQLQTQLTEKDAYWTPQRLYLLVQAAYLEGEWWDIIQIVYFRARAVQEIQ